MTHHKSARTCGDKPGMECLAGWQRALIWIAWLMFLGLCIANSASGSLSFREFVGLAIAIAITVACLNYPAGRRGLDIQASEKLVGEFRSHPEWALILVGTGITLVGLAACFKVVHDLSTGDTTVWGVFEDFLIFFLEMVKEGVSQGAAGDVTNTRMYILIFFLPAGLLMLMFCATTLIWPGVPFRVTNDRTVTIKSKSGWRKLDLADYAEAIADGITLDLTPQRAEVKSISIPLGGVREQQSHAHVAATAIANFFRERLLEAGFQANESATGHSWKLSRPTAATVTESPART